MPTNTYTYNGTMSSLTGGVAAVDGQGPRYRCTFSGTWVVGNGYDFALVTPSITYTLGQGRMTGQIPIAAVTLQNRVHFISGIYWNGSDIGDSTGWEQQTAGAFQIGISGQNQQSENLVSLAPFQGKMVLQSRNTTQVWSLNADPTLITQQQILSNIGTVGTSATQSLGDFDVLFVSDSGIRSLRVMTINLNGFITDLGAPIDSLIKTEIAGQTTTQLGGICSVVEPSAKRFICYFPSTSTMYVLSYFPTAKITAWSTFKPTITGNVTFIPSVFKVYNSVAFFRAVNNSGNGFIGCYGAVSGATSYDDTQSTIKMSWLDLKSQGTRKMARGVDVVIKGQWTISGSMDWYGVTLSGESLKTIANQLNSGQTGVYSSQQKAMLGWTDDGFNAQFKAIADATTNPSTVKKFSELIFYYEPKGAK